ncbi:carbohydrate esterase family 5 protein [Serendipita vermifera MAFF 305830]|uniref:Carbohydrate esterase family 5 protein n=1 Tax=Serendipita vermifera MAFF 305830 TaxID=933852 RepID=A0A0C2WUL3_SERVB|nr:carbohydrate esterase family 5 protein [Serendipita vermifera MAFF 305830]
MFIKNLIAPVLFFTSAFAAPAPELEARQSCGPVKLFHAAGTTESGLGSVGIPLSAALASAVPGATTQAIVYDTSAEYSATVAAGAAIMAAAVNAAATACPNQKFVLSGYSKGALVVHGVTLSSAVKAKVIAITVFGDPARNINSPFPINSASVDQTPRDGSSSSQNVASFCNTGDLFCWPLGWSLPAHLAYPTDGSIGVAATFIKNRA